MKHSNSYGALAILALALIVGVPMIQAQSRTRANVPFDFNLDQKSMPAGTYEISSVNEKVLAVRNLNTGESRLVIASMHVEASPYDGAPQAKLAFRKYGDQYFLAEIWNGNSIGIQFPESKREWELKVASNASQPETVVIAMK
ncbi:MAG TPA: hypothetical protein VKG65_03705 [Terriglobales bacterium]|nr:hypothetical protein [Terriglobales bacterium]